MLNKKKKARALVIVSAVVLGLILLLFIIIDFNMTAGNSISNYKDHQDLLADVILKSALLKTDTKDSNLSDNIISDIKEKYPTSSSMYCIVAKNDELVFLKDDNTTSTIVDEKISNFFSRDNISSRDRRKYIISKSETNFKGDHYILAICTRQSYFLKRTKFNDLRFRCLGYFAIYGVLLLVIIILSFYKLRSGERSIKAFEEEVKNNRLIIEKLEIDKNKNYVNSEIEGDYSFYNRSIVDEVIKGMSDEEKAQCIQIDICVENLRMEHFVQITAILGRIREGRSIACYWEDNKFKVLLFYAGEKEVQEFTHLFISKYKSESEEKVEDLKIVASRLTGGQKF